ncbi:MULTISPECIES: hypothetical protein [unclassified Kribbella]|uniref:hypothetical protein n=1 Tax=unclassified Kribbella TaxID=2644121 RepID=UPI00340486F4
MPNTYDGPPTAARNAPPQFQQRAPIERQRKSSWLDQAPRTLDVVARAACLLAGAALLVTSIVALFADVDQTSLFAVLVAGLLLLIMPTIADRIRKLRLGRFEVQLVRQIAASARGAAQTLQRLGLGRELDAYATVYTELRGPELSDVRGMVLDRIVDRVAGAARVEKFDKDEVRTMFTEGTPVMRVLALGLMEGDPSLVDAAVLHEAVSRSSSANEQYHALRLVRDQWSRLTPPERSNLRSAIEASSQIEPGTARHRLADEIRMLTV